MPERGMGMKLPTKIGLSTLPRPMTEKQAKAYGERNIPQGLRRAGFVVSVFRSDSEIHGADFYRINYSK
jgi:hypothetical protein